MLCEPYHFRSQRRLEKYGFVLVCSFSTAAVRNIFSFLRQILRIFDNYHFDILIILGPMTKKMLHRLPLMENAQIRYMTNGPESFTPDSRYFLGEVPEVGCHQLHSKAVVHSSFFRTATQNLAIRTRDAKLVLSFLILKKYLELDDPLRSLIVLRVLPLMSSISSLA